MASNGMIGHSIESTRTSAIAQIIANSDPRVVPNVLVVGCGSGREAAVLARDLSAFVVGVDIADHFDTTAKNFARLQLGDATNLGFADESFDVVFSYHVLEHIPDYHRALSEMNRVLKSDGTYCIGTPNRERVMGYIGGGSSISEKLRWNLADWRARLRGRFRNEYGSHAGFSASELSSILLAHFSTAEDVSAHYYAILYRRQAWLWRCLAKVGLTRVIFPSVYFIGRR